MALTYPLLEIKDLSISFVQNGARKPVLKHVGFALNRGEIIAIVGESGSGKSITALSIPGLLPGGNANVDSGQILFSRDGSQQEDLLLLSEKDKRSIRGGEVSMIFQEPMTSLNPVFSCGHQVSEAIRLHQHMASPVARAKTIELFRQVKLPDPEAMFNRFPHEISGGQKQRVMIAMAMSCNPSLLIADEPTTALDVTVQKTILLLLKQLQQSHRMGVIFITHDLGIVAEFADRMMVMYQGAIIEQNTTAELFANPVAAYTRALLACRPAGHARGTKLPQVSDFLNEPGADISSPMSTASANPKRETLPVGDNLIEVNHLSVWYPRSTNWLGKVTAHSKAVDDVSFVIRRNETLGLVGESGCGKTTLGRALLRLVAPTAGSIIYNGTDLLRLSAAEFRRMRSNLQIVFQDPFSSLNPRMTIGDSIGEPISVHQPALSRAQRKERVMELLKKVSLAPEHYHRYPHEFSGGQRQRIGIARTLSLNPSFIVFDESVSALDVSVQAQVLNLINDLKYDFNFTALFISHDLSVVRYLCDRVMVMRQGVILESGATDSIYDHPDNEYARQLLEAIPRLPV